MVFTTIVFSFGDDWFSSLPGKTGKGSLWRPFWQDSHGGSLSWGSLSGGSLSRGSLSQGVSVWGLCLGVSVQGVSVPGGSLSGGSLSEGVYIQEGDPLYSNERAIRILLECILVNLTFTSWRVPVKSFLKPDRYVWTLRHGDINSRIRSEHQSQQGTAPPGLSGCKLLAHFSRSVVDRFLK